MAMHKRVLQWQADNPTITWIFWILVWLLVFWLLFRPAVLGDASLGLEHLRNSL